MHSPSRVAIAACMLAGMCTFLNVYDTQPLLPYLQRLYHTSEIAVSFTVSATILAVALTAPFIGLLAESIGRKKVIVPSLVCDHRSDAAGGDLAESSPAHLLALHAGHVRARRDRRHHGLRRRGVSRSLCRPRHGFVHYGNGAGRIRRALSSPAWSPIISTGAMHSSSSA